MATPRGPEARLIQVPSQVGEVSFETVMGEPADLRLLFHRLNNQLGVILAHAELLESKAPDDTSRARAAQVVSSALEAMGTARELCRCTTVSP